MTAVDHDHAARLVTHLSQQRSSGKYCDVCVCVGEQRFLAHKCVLSANSDQLDSLILDATDEDNASHDIEIEIHGVSPVGFEIVLEYFYTGVLRLEPSTVTHTWVTAVYLGLPDIISRCNSYCQQSVCVTAHPKVSAIQTFASSPSQPQAIAVATPLDLNNNGNIIGLQDPSPGTGNTIPAQLSTSTILSTVSSQPRVNSTIKTKGNVGRTNFPVKKDADPQPFEIRENQNNGGNNKEDASESAGKKAKFITMDESAIAWNPYGQHAVSTGQAGVQLPVTSMPQVVVNFVQGYGTYQPVDINTWTSNPQQWAQLQVGKGQLVTAGVLPIASQVKPEPVPTPATAVQIVGGDAANQNNVAEGAVSAGESSPISYTTLSLVSQDSQQSESRNEAVTAAAETATPVPATPAPSGDVPTNQTLAVSLPSSGTTPRAQTVIPAQELNLDNIHFTQINTDNNQQRLSSTPSTTATTFIQPIAMINNLPIANAVADGVKCDTMSMQTEVEQLRIQHQQLQRMRQLGSGENGDNLMTGDVVKAILTSKRKRKAPTRVSKSEDGGGNTQELHAHNNVRKSRSLADSVLVTITPEHMEYLYRKYSEIKKEPPVIGACDVMQLLQHGKARQRKSSEQNALNNTIRTILDTTGIVESGDARVQDAVCLIMDRFTVLQEHMNDAYVRKQLTIKVKHSIHCKKWRLKRHKMKQLEMSSSCSPDARTSWVTDPNNSNASLSPNSSLLNEDSLHS